MSIGEQDVYFPRHNRPGLDLKVHPEGDVHNHLPQQQTSSERQATFHAPLPQQTSEDSTFPSPAKLKPPTHLPTPFISKTARRAAPLASITPTRQTSRDSLSPPSSASPTSSISSRAWDRRGPSPLPSPNIFAANVHPDGLFSMPDQYSSASSLAGVGMVSPALNTGSKTDLFFAFSQAERVPTPPKALLKTGLLGRDHPNGANKEHDRAASLPMPRLAESKGHERIPSGGPESITLTTPTPTSPTVSSSNRVIHRTTASPSPRSDRDTSGQIPSSPLSTLPTLPEVAAISVRHTKPHIEREHHEVGAEDTSVRVGDFLTPSTDEEIHGDNITWRLERKLGEGAFSSVWSASPCPSFTSTPLTAIKVMDERICSSNARAKIAFIREVEVLRHISHQNIVSFLASFSTPSHHCLVLERLEGGELFELMSNDENRRRMMLPGSEDMMGEGFVRRVFGELGRGVGWLHEVGVVHRDIKLES